MRRKLTSLLIAAAMLVPSTPVMAAKAKSPSYKPTARVMEELNRGLIAAYRTKDSRSVMENGVYLSWRLLGTESLANQAFDIYRATSMTGTYTKIHTTGIHDATNYVDKTGTANHYYKIVKKGAAETVVAAEEPVKPGNNYTAKSSEVGNGNSLPNSYTYVDIPISRPAPVSRMGDGKTSYYYNYDSSHEGGANDASVGDLDGDGDYEIVLKWDPTDTKDSAGADFTGNVYIDAYEIDENNGGYKWRIDLGKNVTAGAHYTQFIVYDLDGDGCAEVAMKTAPGTKDGQGNSVSEVGDTEAIRNVDNTKSFIGTSGRLKGKNPFTQYLTIFDGETGAALYTTEYIPYEMHGSSYWGDSGAKYNRSERYLAGVAYLDGVKPSLIMCRGYYDHAVVRAYDWDGSDLTMLWEHDAGKKSASTLYGQGNHNLSIGDIDDDEYDEIVYGSAALDHDGSTAMGNTFLGHGDAMHMNDFNNDGEQNVFSVKEDSKGYKYYAEDLRVAETGEHFWSSGKITTSSDNGRGVMANVDDEYALAHSNALALGWSSGGKAMHDLNGDAVGDKPASAGKGSFMNSLVFWDGDLGRELLDYNIIQKYSVEKGTKRFYGSSDGYTFGGTTANNFTKANACLSADIWGDWREEVIMSVNKDSASAQAYLRIYTSTIPTDYRLTTLMHDSQYRCAIAWQNVAYNQPPHTSYYIGSAALATDSSGNTLNYLAPTTSYTSVRYSLGNVAVTGISLSEDTVEVERGKTVTVNAVIEPSNASKKGVIWTSEDSSVATVAGGIIKGVGIGETTIKATTKDGGYEASCTVSVFEIPVTGIELSPSSVSVGVGYTARLKANILPDNATDTDVTWTTNDASVATVSSEGIVTGVSYGSTKITATAADGIYKAECSVSVRPMTVTDRTGSDPFISTTNDSDFSGTATSGALTLSDSDNEISEYHKDVTPYSDNIASVNMRLLTGGQKYDGTNWDWDGHEYTMNLQFLDEDGNNILTLSQPYAASPEAGKTGAGSMLSKVGNNAEGAFSTEWTTVVDGIGNIQGSNKRWIVNIDFDYNNDTAEATVIGTDSEWESELGKYTKTIDLNGASFKTVKVTVVKDGAGMIKANPTLSGFSYIQTQTASGLSENLYERGYGTDWSAADLSDWVQTNTDTAALSYDSNMLLYNPTKPGSSYSATKTISGINNDSTVTYDIDWYFGGATNRFVNVEYIQLGSDIRFGWLSYDGSYYVLLSTDGGESYIGRTNNDGYAVDSDQALLIGKSGTKYTKHINAVFNIATNTLKSLSFDGTELTAYSDLALSDNAAADYVRIGFDRGGGTDGWEYPNGIEKIKVAQFTYGDFTEPDPTPTPEATSTPEATQEPEPTATPSAKTILIRIRR